MLSMKKAIMKHGSISKNIQLHTMFHYVHCCKRIVHFPPSLCSGSWQSRSGWDNGGGCAVLQFDGFVWPQHICNNEGIL